jgi:hypothetical protein
MQRYFQPKTPFSAFRAAEEGLLPPEAYIYKATSIEPIAENPGNLEEIERILGQKERDFQTNMLLIDILSRLIKNPDKEIALFAAESINAIENDYNRTIENLNPDEYKKKARIYSEMAELNKAVPDLKNFYLREAFTNYRKLEKEDNTDEEDLLSMCRILIELKLLSQARKILYDNNLKGIEARFVLSDIAFRERNYSELFSIMKQLNEKRSMMDINQTDIIDFWMGIE